MGAYNLASWQKSTEDAVSRLNLESCCVINTMTKRLGYIITEENVTEELCRLAIIEASKDKRSRYGVQRVLRNLTKYARELREIILNGTYEPSPYKECHIIDRGSGKHRVLHKPKFFPDQCVHHITIKLIEPRLRARLDTYAIASIKGKGTIYGYKAIKRWLGKDPRHTKYCLKCDIRKCYENIKPEVVIRAFEKFIKDKRYIELIKKIAYSHTSLPLGNYTSSWFENLVLLELDKLCHENAAHYLRYVDDFILLGSNKRKLRSLLLKISLCLAEQGVWLKQNYQVFPIRKRGIDMLGYRFWHGGKVLMRKRNLLHLLRVVRKWKKRKTPHRARSLLSRIGNMKWFNSTTVRKHLTGIKRKELIYYANRNY